MALLCAKPANGFSSGPHLASPAAANQRWYAIQNRQESANSEFWYGVTSTRIYCRPTCIGRVPKRANTIFFNNRISAKASGYRACKRCKPDDGTWNRQTQALTLVQQGQSLIRDAVDKGRDWMVAEVAGELGIGGAHLHRLFKRYLRTTPRLFAENLKDEGKGKYLSSATESITNETIPRPIAQNTAKDGSMLANCPHYLSKHSEMDLNDCLFDTQICDGLGSPAIDHVTPESEPLVDPETFYPLDDSFDISGLLEWTDWLSFADES